MQFSTVIGQNEVGMAFNIEAETDEEFVDFKMLLQNLHSHDALSRTSYYWVRSSMSYENVTVYHNPDISTATTVKITAAYGKIYIHFKFSISVYCYFQYVTILLLSVSQFTATSSMSLYCYS